MIQNNNVRKDTLKSIRVKFGYKQKEIADFLDVSVATYAKWEKNNSKMPLDKLQKLCEKYNVELTDIFIGDIRDYKRMLR